MKHDNDIKEVACKLYLTPDETDPRHKKHSSRQIVKIIEQQLNKKVSYTTVCNWIKEGRWEDQWDRYLQYGAWRTAEESEAETEKCVDDARSDALVSYFEANDLHLSLSDYLITFKLEQFKRRPKLITPTDLAIIHRINTAAKIVVQEKEEHLRNKRLSDTAIDINYNVIHLDSDDE